jgi:beta-glucosidase
MAPVSYLSFTLLLLWSVGHVQCRPPGDIADIPILRRDSVPAGYEANPYYPAPKGGWVSSWSEAYAKAQNVVSQMTLAEKVNLTSGVGLYMVSTVHATFATLGGHLSKLIAAGR